MPLDIGTRVTIRTDLVVDEEYGGVYFARGMERFLGKEVVIAEYAGDSYIGEYTYHISEDTDDYIWSESMFIIPAESKVKAQPMERINKEFLERMYRETGIKPIQRDCIRVDGNQIYADMLGLYAILLGYDPNPHSDLSSFYQMFWTQEYIDGLISGWDEPIIDEELRQHYANNNSNEDRRNGWLDGCEAILHLKSVGLIECVR
jgi:hypothetical protein